MRTALLLSWLACAALVSAQTATQPAPSAPAKTAPPAQSSQEKDKAPATQKPAAPNGQPAAQKPPSAPAAGQPAAQKPSTPAGRGTQPANTRGGFAFTVLNMQGFPIDGVKVELSVTAVREGVTEGGGLVNFASLPTGLYRIRFSGESVTTLEREMTLPAGRTTSLEINLSPAPPPKEVIKVVEAPAPPPVSLPQGPAGQPGILDVPELLEKDFVRKDPRRDTLLACSGSMRTMMLQLNEPLERLYENAEVIYYAIGGEGTVRLAGKEAPLKINGLVSVPRGTSHVINRRGNRPLILLVVIGGEPCDAPK